MVKHTLVLKMLSDRSSRAKIISDTRPRGGGGTKRVSEHIDYLVKFEFEQVQQVLSLLMVSIGRLVLCTCDGHNDDICWVPVTNILFLLKTPSLTTGIQRQCYLHNDNQKYIQDVAL